MVLASCRRLLWLQGLPLLHGRRPPYDQLQWQRLGLAGWCMCRNVQGCGGRRAGHGRPAHGLLMLWLPVLLRRQLLLLLLLLCLL